MLNEVKTKLIELANKYEISEFVLDDRALDKEATTVAEWLKSTEVFA